MKNIHAWGQNQSKHDEHKSCLERELCMVLLEKQEICTATCPLNFSLNQIKFSDVSEKTGRLFT
jgi:hypothetical protein